MAIQVSGQQDSLEEQKARGPDRGRAAQERKNHPRDHRLNEEKQAGIRAQRGRKQEKHGALRCNPGTKRARPAVGYPVVQPLAVDCPRTDVD